MPIDIQLTTDVRPSKYGLVTVVKRDGTLDRQYRITAQELADFTSSPNTPPRGVTITEYNEGRFLCSAKAYDVGDISPDVAKDQTPIYRLKIAERTDVLTGNMTEDYIVIPRADATGVFPRISVAPDKLLSGIVSIRDGVITLVDGVLTKG